MAETARLRLRVAPGADRTAIVGRYGEGWKVKVASPADRGRANAAVRRLLAETLDLPERSVTLLSGHTGRDKVVELRGLDGAEAERRLAAAG